MGYAWKVGGIFVRHSHEPALQAWPDKEITYGRREPYAGRLVITLDDLYIAPFAKPNLVSVVLNSSHTAKVTKDNIEVGCQTFPISVLDELVKARDSLS